MASLALAVTACGGQAPSVSLPAKASGTPVTSASAAARPQSPQQLVTAAYRGYWRAYAVAMASGRPARARTLLAPYEVQPGLRHLVTSLRHVWSAHQTAYGSAVPHVLSVRVTGQHALVHDCLDLSHFGVQEARTGLVLPQSFGLPNLNYYVTLVRTGGRWRVSNMQQVEVSCQP